MMHCHVCYIVHCYSLPQHALGDVQDKRGVHLVSLYFRAATTELGKMPKKFLQLVKT